MVSLYSNGCADSGCVVLVFICRRNKQPAFTHTSFFKITKRLFSYEGNYLIINYEYLAT